MNLERLFNKYKKTVKDNSEKAIINFTALATTRMIDFSEEALFLFCFNYDQEYEKAFEVSHSKKLQSIINNIDDMVANDPAEFGDNLGDLYEHGLLKQSKKKKLGAFYTPLSFCEEVYESKKIKPRNKVIYDPFCGTGNWLIPSVQKTGRLKVKGTDIDKTAVFIARLRVLSRLKNRSMNSLMEVQNSISVNNPLKSNEGTVSQDYFNEASLILTNPPYGFSISKEMKSDIKIPDKEIFYYCIYHVTKAMNDSANSIFLIPNTILLNQNAKDFRRKLIETHPTVINDLSEHPLFTTAYVRTVLLELQSNKPKDKYAYHRGIDGRKKLMCKSTFIDRDTLRQRLFKNEIKINDLFEVSQGLIPYDKYRGHTEYQIKNRVYHSNKKDTKFHRPEIAGKDIFGFRPNFSGKRYIKYGDWLAAPREKKFFTNKRVLIREITNSSTGRLTVGYAEKEFYNTPSIINVIPRKEVDLDPEKALKTLTVLLSSSIYSDYHFNNNPKAKKGLFPKILVSDVRKLPVPKELGQIDLSRFYEKLINLSKTCEINELQALIDKEVNKELRRFIDRKAEIQVAA